MNCWSPSVRVRKFLTVRMFEDDWSFKDSGEDCACSDESSRFRDFGVWGIIGCRFDFLIALAYKFPRIVGELHVLASSLETPSLDSLVRRNVAMGILSHLLKLFMCLPGSTPGLSFIVVSSQLSDPWDCAVSASTSTAPVSEVRNATFNTSSMSMESTESISKSDV